MLANQRSTALRVTTATVAACAALLLAACGGGEVELTSQQLREAQALQRGHAMNAEAMKAIRIKGERSAKAPEAK